MKSLRTLLAVGGILVAFGSGASPSDESIAREIARLEASLKEAEAADLPDDVRGLFAVHRDALARAKRATAPEYRLYRLRDPFVGIETLSFLAKQKDARQSVERFTPLWESSRARFETIAPHSRGTLLERALIESSTTRAERLFHASLPYAKASSPWSGVYYLGEAEGNLRFRDFVRSIAGGGTSEKAPERARIAALLDELERATVKFFGSDITNQPVIAVSVRLKEARELLDAGRLDGATLMAVEARAALSRRGGPSPAYPQEAAGRRGTIPALLETWASDEEPPMSDALRKEVLPYYGALFLAGPPRAATRAAQVTVTLVRWPYT